jgi:hypothetical protein
VTFRNTPTDAVFIGGSTEAWDHISRNIRLTNNYVDEGLCFMLAVAVKGLTVDGLVVKHRTTEPPGPAGRLAQDEDIAVFSANGVDSENIVINNITIDSRGTRANAHTGYLKIHLETTTGRTMTNVAISNVVIKDNIGTIPEISFWYGNYCSLTINDADWDQDSYRHSSFKNLTLNNICLENSGGVFIQAHDIQCNNLSIDGIPVDWATGALITQATKGMDGCVFTSTRIANWITPERVMNLEGEGIIFNGLKLKNCAGSFIAPPNATITDFLIDNCGSVAEGALYTAGTASDGLILRNGTFRDCANTALMENINNRAVDCILSGVRFINNGTNTNIWDGQWRISDCLGLSGVGAALSIRGTTGGLLLPTLTTTERDAITGAGGVLNGMVIFNSTTSTIQRYIAGWADI